MAGKKGRTWTSEGRLLSEMRNMSKEERATFLLNYARCWRRAVLSGHIKGSNGGAVLRELEKIKQDRRKGKR